MVFQSHPYGIVTDSLIAGKTNAKIHINNWQLEHLKQKMQVLAHDEYSWTNMEVLWLELRSSEGRRSAARSICWNCCKALKQRRASLPDKEKNDDKAKVKDPKDLKDGKEKTEKEKKDKEEKADKEKEKSAQKEKKAELF